MPTPINPGQIPQQSSGMQFAYQLAQQFQQAQQFHQMMQQMKAQKALGDASQGANAGAQAGGLGGQTFPPNPGAAQAPGTGMDINQQLGLPAQMQPVSPIDPTGGAAPIPQNMQLAALLRQDPQTALLGTGGMSP
jgi:hypothetical protein